MGAVCVWHPPCREIVAFPQLVRGHSVLEIGAGCGLNGIIAAKMGAAEVGWRGVSYVGGEGL